MAKETEHITSGTASAHCTKQFKSELFLFANKTTVGTSLHFQYPSICAKISNEILRTVANKNPVKEFPY